MRAPEEGETHEPVSWAEVDLDAIKAELAEAVEEARANDPKTLKAEIARLRKELAGKGNGVTAAVDIEAIRRAGLEEGRRLGAEESARPNYERGYSDAKQALAATIAGLKPARAPGRSGGEARGPGAAGAARPAHGTSRAQGPHAQLRGRAAACGGQEVAR